MKAAYCKYDLIFHHPAITSRAVMNCKETYFIKVWDENCPDVYGIGECALFRGLSAEDTPEYEQQLRDICLNIDRIAEIDLSGYSSIQFGVETAILDYKNGGKFLLYPNVWSEGRSEIKINGLVWMGSFEEMYNRIKEKLDAGFKCIKLKVGGIDFNQEIELIKFIRTHFDADTLELRLDANGAFSIDNALPRLNELSKFQIHSIEQPIKPKQMEMMAMLCRKSPIPIALDEELIGINNFDDKQSLLTHIKPQYIILKPALCGGLSGAEEWINIAESQNIGWWATSALESNIGLNAIAQWLSTHQIRMPQGLGTGQLYINNIPSPLVQVRDVLKCDNASKWEIPQLNWIMP